MCNLKGYSKGLYSNLSVAQLYIRKRYLHDYLISFNEIESYFNRSLHSADYKTVMELYHAVSDEIVLKQR
jgi:hypothetical protein